MTGDYVRDGNGFCIPAGVNEPGELIGVVPDLDEAKADMYTDANAASKKVHVCMYSDAHHTTNNTHDQGIYMYLSQAGAHNRVGGDYALLLSSD